ncbi:MAG: hypothetical protein HRT37_18090, partial [Alteromonadaceae bacterium]|nr:hypothetical protein [Alteromonadaceae bacterium]
LTVTGTSTLVDDVTANANLTVQGDTQLDKTLTVTGTSTLVDDVTANAKLTVQGDTQLDKTLTVTGTSRLVDDVTANANLTVEGEFNLASGDFVNAIDNNHLLGGDLASASALATQHAIKHYIDFHAPVFGLSTRTHIIRNQEQFEEIFGDGTEITTIVANSTVVLMPPLCQQHDLPYTHVKSVNDDANWGDFEVRQGNDIADIGSYAYIMKNSVNLETGVSIIGFNEHTTKVLKQNPNDKFCLTGSSDYRVSNIRIEGWTFDGGCQFATGNDCNGGAFKLDFARSCIINCQIVGHWVTGNGGGIYGSNSSKITAEKIIMCKADSGQGNSCGGGAYGLMHSVIEAYGCGSEYGGGVALCSSSTIKAVGCCAIRGGGAYESDNIQLLAVYCTASSYGGGAYKCENLVCSGHWGGNTSNHSPNIYSTYHHDDWYWTGLYIGGRIKNYGSHSPWNCYNI